jgi:hypothetical protein
MVEISQIRRWFAMGLEQKSTHMLVVCDGYNHEDYPVFVSREKDANKIYEDILGWDMQSVMEVYDLSLDLDSQLRENRAFHLPAKERGELDNPNPPRTRSLTDCLGDVP